MNDDNNKNKRKEQSDEELLKNVAETVASRLVSDIDTHVIPVGLNEDVVRPSSKVKANRNGCSTSV